MYLIVYIAALINLVDIVVDKNHYVVLRNNIPLRPISHNQRIFYMYLFSTCDDPVYRDQMEYILGRIQYQV